jgi:hypothetical protein
MATLRAVNIEMILNEIGETVEHPTKSFNFTTAISDSPTLVR